MHWPGIEPVYITHVYVINYHIWPKCGLNQECPSFLGAKVREIMWADIYIYIYIYTISMKYRRSATKPEAILQKHQVFDLDSRATGDV